MVKQLNIFNLIYKTFFNQEKVNLIDEIIHALGLFDGCYSIEYGFNIRGNILENQFEFIINTENLNLMFCLKKIISKNIDSHISKDIVLFGIGFIFNKEGLLLSYKKLYFNLHENNHSLCILDYNIENNNESNIYYKKNIFELSTVINNINYNSNIQFISDSSIFIKLNNILDKELFIRYNIPIELYNFRFTILFIQMDLIDLDIFIDGGNFPSNFNFYLAI